MCIGSIPYQVKVPYGVLEVNHEKIISLREKPTYTYYSNSGIYFIHKKVRDQIPKATFYNATDLMTALIDDEKKVSHYPILGYWMDIGKYEDYVKVQEDIKHIKF
jgi:NDP-sugar pyrophosphorylase family protein